MVADALLIAVEHSVEKQVVVLGRRSNLSDPAW